MKFKCLKNELIQAVTVVSKALSNKPQTPVIAGIYLKAENNYLELQATNYEIGIICKIPAEIEQPGTTIISGKYAQEVIRKLPGEFVTMEYNRQNKIINITANRSSFTLLSMDSNDFPVIEPIEADLQFVIKENVLRELINKTVFACSNDESRPIFTGCLLEIDDNNVTMAATNTHRLAINSDVVENLNGQKSIIIPSKVLNELSRIIISELPGDVVISCNSKQISFQYENMYILSRLIEGQFPDYRRVVPLDYKTRATVNTEEFSAAVDRISLISRSNNYKTIKMEFSNNQVVISSNNPDVGYAEELVPVLIDGDDVTISFNSIYMADVLRIITSEKFYINMNKPLDSAGIRQENDDNYIYVITPVRNIN